MSRICRIIFLPFIILFLTGNSFTLKGQDRTTDIELENFFKTSVVKNRFCYSALINRHLDSALYSLVYSDDPADGYYFTYTPGFGYLPLHLLDFKIEKLVTAYPNKEFELYSIKIQDKSSQKYFKSIEGTYLIGSNRSNRKQIKYISGSLLKHRIAADFKFKKGDPKSYIPYLQLKCFSLGIMDFEYKGKEEAQYVYECQSNSGNGGKYIIKFDPATPEKYHREYIGNDKSEVILNGGAVINMRKEDLILNEVMKNIYAHLINTSSDFASCVDDQFYLKKYDLKFDELLPDFDETLVATLNKEKGMVCQCGRNDDPCPHGGKRDKCRYEIYSVMVTEGAIKKSAYSLQTKEVKDDKVKSDDSDQYRMLPIYAGKSNAPKYYLIAFDTTNANLFYLSGEFYLSKVLNLYYLNWQENIQRNGSGWRRTDDGSFNYFFKNYMRDRLYSYHLKDETISKIIKDDAHEFVGEAISIVKGKEFPILININYDNPEVVNVSIRNER